MNKLEYVLAIKNLRKKIQVAEPQEISLIETRLKQLGAIKPLRLNYFLAQAEFMLKTGIAPREVLRFIQDKVQIYLPEKNIKEFFALCEQLMPADDCVGKQYYRFQTAIYDNQSVIEYYEALQRARINFMNNVTQTEFIKELANQYYITQNIYLYFLTMLLYCKLENCLASYGQYIREDVLKLFNLGYLVELLTDGKQHGFMLVMDSLDNSQDYEIMKKILATFNQSIFILQPPVSCNIINNLSSEDLLNISLNNLEQDANTTIFHPIKLLKNGIVNADNRADIIAHIINNCVESALVTVFSSGKILDELAAFTSSEYPMRRLSTLLPDCFIDKIAFGWTGNYVEYIGMIYQENVLAKLVAPAQVEFSIVIPARNSATMLRYTLQTCLEQRFQGSYEIVLSDNSTYGNKAVYDLYKELNDPRITYVKPPHELPLVKSFEFAFLQAKGEFIFSIGSDDGVLPWALDILHILLQKYPNEDLLLWGRGGYAWPGYNDGQQHEFTIPGIYKHGEIPVAKLKTAEMLETVLKSPDHMYLLPTLYINSGFRKRYLPKILARTKSLWNDICQDIDMGVLNCVINDEILFLQYPLTIAGGSSSSIGYTENKPLTINTAIKLATRGYDKQGNGCQSFGQYIPLRRDYAIPMVGVDPMGFYHSLLRFIWSGNLEKAYLQKIDWQKIYITMASRLSKKDVLLEKKLGLFRYAAQLVRPQLTELVDNVICKQLYKQEVFPGGLDTKNSQRTYTITTVNEENGIVLDASEYGVKDIYGAVKLFEKITGL